MCVCLQGDGLLGWGGLVPWCSLPVSSAIPAPLSVASSFPRVYTKTGYESGSGEILSVLNLQLIFPSCVASALGRPFPDKHLWFREPSNRLETSGLWVLTLGLPWHSVWPWAIHLISVQTLWCLITGFSRSFPANKDIWNHSWSHKGRLHFIILEAFSSLSPFAHLPMPGTPSLIVAVSPSLRTTFLLFFPKMHQQCYSISVLPGIPNLVSKYILHKTKLPRLLWNSVNRAELDSALDFIWLLEIEKS